MLALAGVVRLTRRWWSRPLPESGPAPRDVAAVALLVAAVAVPMAAAYVAVVSGHSSAAQWLAGFTDAELIALVTGCAGWFGWQGFTTGCPPAPPGPALKVGFGVIAAFSVLSVLLVLVPR